ncbi:MAG TPA: hypothetical protein VFJ98_03695 [Mycobacteriales bacterium]|nr:hypothetical protein [Mycobacteriales bacterium]
MTVTVPARPATPVQHQPDSSLPFTGAPLEALTAWGVVVAAAGAAVAMAARRRRPTPRSVP